MEGEPTSDERDPVEELTARGAEMVDDNLLDLEDVTVPDRDEGREPFDISDEELRERIAARLQEQDDPDDEVQRQDQPDPRDPVEIDWRELWEEFGFDTPNANGDAIAHHPQLVGAIESSDQGIGRRADGVIDEGVRDGAIDPVTAEAAEEADVPTVTVGYRLGGGRRV